jgi:hypothetical protein
MACGVKADSAAIDEGGGYNSDRNRGQPFRGTSGAKHRKSNQWFSFHASSILIFCSILTTRNIAQKTMRNTSRQINFGVAGGTLPDPLGARET